VSGSPSFTGGQRRLMLRIGLFVLLGSPLVGFLWETLNQVLAGRFEPLMLLGFLPAALLFWLLLRSMARAVESWHTTPPDSPL
jgi:Na+/melibiose symporter-like transporter